MDTTDVSFHGRVWRGAWNAFTGKTAFWFVVGAYLVPGVVVLALARPLSEAYVGPLLGDVQTRVFNVVVTMAAWTYAVWIAVSLWRCANGRQRFGLGVTPILLLVALAILIPGYADYSVRAKLQEGVNLANPARTALAIACRENELVPGLGHEDLGLNEATRYNGTYTRSVHATVPEAGIGLATITFKQLLTSGAGWPIRTPKTAVREGDTFVYVGTCGPGGIEWAVSPQSTAPREFWPRT